MKGVAVVLAVAVAGLGCWCAWMASATVGLRREVDQLRAELAAIEPVQPEPPQELETLRVRGDLVVDGAIIGAGGEVRIATDRLGFSGVFIERGDSLAALTVRDAFSGLYLGHELSRWISLRAGGYCASIKGSGDGGKFDAIATSESAEFTVAQPHSGQVVVGADEQDRDWQGISISRSDGPGAQMFVGPTEANVSITRKPGEAVGMMRVGGDTGMGALLLMDYDDEYQPVILAPTPRRGRGD